MLVHTRSHPPLFFSLSLPFTTHTHTHHERVTLLTARAHIFTLKELLQMFILRFATSQATSTSIFVLNLKLVFHSFRKKGDNKNVLQFFWRFQHLYCFLAWALILQIPHNWSFITSLLRDQGLPILYQHINN